MRARVYKRNGGRWYIDFTDHAGSRARRWVPEAKTKADAQEALHRALDREARLRDGRLDLIDNGAKVSGLLEGFLLHKLATKRYATVAFYRTAFADMLGCFRTPEGTVWPPERETPADVVRNRERTFEPGALAAERVDQITPERVEQYLEAQRGDKATRTLNKAVVALKTMLEWARKAGKIKSNPVAELSRVGKPAKSDRALDVHEAERLLAISPEPYHTLWLAFLTTGMRRGELVKLRWPEVDFATDTIRILPDTTKSKRQRDVPIVPELRERLMALRYEAKNPDGYVFTNQDGGPWVNNLGRRFDRCAELALVGKVERRDGHWVMVYHENGREVSEPLPGVKGWKNAKAELYRRRGDKITGVSPHTLRHTYATQLLLNGVNPKVVSDLLGHSSIQITLDIYGHCFPRNKQEAVTKLPFVGNQNQRKGHWQGTGENVNSQLGMAQ